MGKVFFCIAIFAGIHASGQEKSPLSISGYAEVYYSYDFNRPSNNTRPAFLYNFNRHNEFNINLGYIKAAYAIERVRGNLALGIGSYMNANYAAEPGVLKNIFEANVGFKLSSKKNLWLDLGILPSHIGFESAIGKDNWALTRSLVAENSPYFESGARLSYTTNNNKLTLSALALNGWQRITRLDGNSLMSWGTQVYFKPSDKLTLNYSTFAGTDKPDSARRCRYYQNLYAIWQASGKFGITAGFDIGSEQKLKGRSDMNSWFTPVAILRISPDSQWSLAYRVEYFNDRHGVIISTGTANGFATLGNSVNIDYSPVDKIMLRLEARHLGSKDDIFTKEGRLRAGNTSVIFSTSIAF